MQTVFEHCVTLFVDVFFSDREDSPDLPPPPGVSDNRQCVLCLKYGDENTNVSRTSAWTPFHTHKYVFVSLVTCLFLFRREAGCCTSVRMSGPM